MADLIPCAHCGVMFEPTRAGHIYHTPECRYGGPVDPDQRQVPDTDAIDRLFAKDRDPEERVRPDDWHPDPPGSAFRALDAHDTVAQRRTWYLGLLHGRLR
jgi:hypothetical protein